MENKLTIEEAIELSKPDVTDSEVQKDVPPPPPGKKDDKNLYLIEVWGFVQVGDSYQFHTVKGAICEPNLYAIAKRQLSSLLHTGVCSTNRAVFKMWYTD